MLTEKRRYWVARLAMVILGVLFIIAGLGKLIAGQVGFTLSFVPQVLTGAIYSSLPYIELLIGCLLIFGLANKFAISVSALLIIAFAAFNILWITLGVESCVGCFGSAVNLIPAVSLLVDILMGGLVAVIILCHRGGFFNGTPWFLEIAQVKRV